MDIERIKSEAFRDALLELKEEHKDNSIYLKKLEEYEVKENGKETELLDRKKS